MGRADLRGAILQGADLRDAVRAKWVEAT
ncbi:MAG: pentapeptide repeat-containing protein [Bifidobacteriaceae bacterium]|nr:pentapeptide repeat-containing protein [Bifidobacteriaceae bacterium]